MGQIEDDLIVVKLRDGEDFFESLKEKVRKYEIRSGLVLSGIGMLRELALGYFVSKGKYDEVNVADPVELTSMQGNIAMAEEDTVFHVHVTGATGEGKVVGGHLISAKVNVVNEIVILKLNRIRLRRELNEKTGLLEIVICDESGS